MLNKKRLNISMAFDEKYVPYAYTTILSIFENNTGSEVFLYVLQRELSEDSKRHISELACKYCNQVIFLTIDPEKCSDKLPTSGWWPVEVYFRLFLPELLPDDVDRILYIDGDMIINHSLMELYSTDLEGYDLAGCYDKALEKASLEVFLENRHSDLEELYTKKEYINSGMLLMNIKRLRENYSFSSYIDALNELDFKVHAPDQDLINYVHRENIKYLDPLQYNYPGYMVYYDLDGYEDAKNKVTIIHYIGTKPWQGGNHIHYDTEKIWWEYAYRTPFAEELMRRYIDESVIDTTIEDRLTEEFNAKNTLFAENTKLRKDLAEALESVKNVIGMLSKNET